MNQVPTTLTDDDNKEQSTKNRNQGEHGEQKYQDFSPAFEQSIQQNSRSAIVSPHVQYFEDTQYAQYPDNSKELHAGH